MSSGISSHASRRALDSSRDTNGTWLAGSSMHVSPKCNASQWVSDHARLELRGRAYCARIPRAKQNITFDRALESLWMRIIAKQFIALTHSGIRLEASRQFGIAFFVCSIGIRPVRTFNTAWCPASKQGQAANVRSQMLDRLSYGRPVLRIPFCNLLCSAAMSRRPQSDP
jgi:hypothetical protein